ncbi:SH3 domain-containing protein [Pseudomonadota bacterium]
MKKFYTIFLTFLLILIIKINDVEAKSKNFFVSLRADSVNMRIGPNIQNPVKFTYQVKGLPMEVLDEFDGWYKLKDHLGDSGWVNKNLTSKKKTAIVLNETQIVFKKNNIESRPILRIGKGIVVKIKKCSENWCKIRIEDYVGWMEKKGLWGGI